MGNTFENIVGVGVTEITGYIDTSESIPLRQTYKTFCIDSITNDIITDSISTWIINNVDDVEMMNEYIDSYSEKYGSDIIVSSQIIARIYSGTYKISRDEFNSQLSGRTVNLIGSTSNSYMYTQFNIDYHLNDTPDENALSSLSIKYGLTDIIKDPTVWQIPNYDPLYVTESIVKNSEGRQSL